MGKDKHCIVMTAGIMYNCMAEKLEGNSFLTIMHYYYHLLITP